MANYCPFISTWAYDYGGVAATEHMSDCKTTDCQLWEATVGKCSFRFIPDVVTQLSTLNNSVDEIESDVEELVSYWRTHEWFNDTLKDIDAEIKLLRGRFDTFDGRFVGPSTPGNLYALLSQFDARWAGPTGPGNMYTLIDNFRQQLDTGGTFFNLVNTQLTSVNTNLTNIETVMNNWYTDFKTWSASVLETLQTLTTLHRELTQEHIKRIRQIMEEQWEYAKSMMNQTNAILHEQGLLP